MRTIQIMLRTQQINYLRRLAAREDFTLSDALATILDATSQTPIVPRTPTKEYNAHVRISPEHLALLDKMAVCAGLTRSDIARRLIDAAIQSELAFSR